jgi:hypothetical protein
VESWRVKFIGEKRINDYSNVELSNTQNMNTNLNYCSKNNNKKTEANNSSLDEVKDG